MVLVPANMSRLCFGPCKKKFVFGPYKIFCFLNQSLQGLFSETNFFAGTCLKKKNFCRDQKLQNGSSHHVPRIQIIRKMGSRTILKNKKFCRDQKQIFYLQGPKLKRGIFAGTSAIFKPKMYYTFKNVLSFKHHNFYYYTKQ